MEALFWWEATDVSASPQPTLTADDVCSALGSASASFLGRGAFGETWKIVDATGAVQAAKIIVDARYPTSLLTREVRGLRRVSDRRVVRLDEVVEVELPDGQRPALIFEFVGGGDVASRIGKGELPSLDEAHSMLVGLLGGVAALHATDTVHRDIKPENIALRGEAWSAPVLLDLGLAKMLGNESITRYPALMGTLPYMAPEQVAQEPARKAADVWAVGVVGYLLLTGAHPFFGDRSQAVSHDVALSLFEAGPKPLPAHVPASLSTPIRRLLSFEAHERGSSGRAYKEMSAVRGR